MAATPATAYAESVDDADTVGDMVRYSLGSGATTPVPERTLNDISNTKLTHGDRRVGIKVDYVDLKRKARHRIQYLNLKMVTNEGARREIWLSATRRHPSGKLDMFNGPARRQDVVDCAARHSIDYEANVMKVGFPRRCASNPRWIRFKVLSGADTRFDGDLSYEDDGLRDRPRTPRLKQSERVHRGQQVERGVADAHGRLVQSSARCRGARGSD
jgi:hypothetical protein